MIVKVNILSPFRYEYQGKRSWVASGDRLTLDTSNRNQKEELKYIMSSNFPYKEFIYIDVASLPEALRCEVEEEAGFYRLPDTPVEEPEEPVSPGFFKPLGEAEDNKFIHPVINQHIEDTDKISDDEPLVETKLEEDCIELEEIEKIEKEEGELQAEQEELQEDLLKSRKDELKQTPWEKVKDILESYGEEYNNKPEAIDTILSIEF